MASSLSWKVYTMGGEYIASVKSPLYGAMLLAGLGAKGTTIRYGHKHIVFTDFVDADASESYDVVHDISTDRASRIIARFQSPAVSRSV